MNPAAAWILPLSISMTLLTIPAPSYAASQSDHPLIAGLPTDPASLPSERQRIAEQYDLNIATKHNHSSTYQATHFLQIGDWGISTEPSSSSAVWRIAMALWQAL